MPPLRQHDSPHDASGPSKQPRHHRVKREHDAHHTIQGDRYSDSQWALLTVNSQGEATCNASALFVDQIPLWFNEQVKSTAIDIVTDHHQKRRGQGSSSVLQDGGGSFAFIQSPAGSLPYPLARNFNDPISNGPNQPNSFLVEFESNIPERALRHWSPTSGISDAYFATMVNLIQQQGAKTIAKCWIRIIEPKKQSHFPYREGDRGKPRWWPRDLRHKEPDHLRAEERQVLLIAILRSGVVSMVHLEGRTMETIHELPTEKMMLLKEVFRVAKADEELRGGWVPLSTPLGDQDATSSPATVMQNESGQSEPLFYCAPSLRPSLSLSTANLSPVRKRCHDVGRQAKNQMGLESPVSLDHCRTPSRYSARSPHQSVRAQPYPHRCTKECCRPQGVEQHSTPRQIYEPPTPQSVSPGSSGNELAFPSPTRGLLRVDRLEALAAANASGDRSSPQQTQPVPGWSPHSIRHRQPSNGSLRRANRPNLVQMPNQGLPGNLFVSSGEMMMSATHMSQGGAVGMSPGAYVGSASYMLSAPEQMTQQQPEGYFDYTPRSENRMWANSGGFPLQSPSAMGQPSSSGAALSFDSLPATPIGGQASAYFQAVSSPMGMHPTLIPPPSHPHHNHPGAAGLSGRAATPSSAASFSFSAGRGSFSTSSGLGEPQMLQPAAEILRGSPVRRYEEEAGGGGVNDWLMGAGEWQSPQVYRPSAIDGEM